MGTLGTLASLAFAFPLNEGAVGMDAHTAAARTGFYAVAATKVGHVVNGVEVLSVGATSIAANVLMTTPASTAAGAGLNIGQGTAPTSPNNGDVWITTAGMYARVNGATVGPFGAGGGGTVTSVGLTLPSIFTVTVSPITTTGSLTAILANQNANLVFAGPATGVAAAPTFRSLVAADLPAGTGTVTGTGVAGQAAYWSGTSAITGNAGFTFSIGGGLSVSGNTAASPSVMTLSATGGSGANVAGAALTLTGGSGTGTGVGGAVIIQTAPVTTSSSTPNTLTTRWTVGGDGGTQWTGIATASAPALSAANNGTIYYNSTTQSFLASVNGGAYAALGGGSGTIGGSIANTQIAVGSGANTIAGSAGFTWTANTVVMLANSNNSLMQVSATNVGLQFSTDHSGGTPHAMGIDQTLNGTTTSNDLIFWNYGSPAVATERFRFVNSSGNLQFANGANVVVQDTVTSPTTSMSVVNNCINGVANSGNSYIYLNLPSVGLQLSTDHTSGASHATGMDMTLNGTGTYNDLIFWTYATGGVQERMRILNQGALRMVASNATTASFNIQEGTVPASPNNGDIWTTSLGVYAQIGGSTVGPFASSSGGTVTGTGTANQVAYWSATSAITGNAGMTFSPGVGFHVTQTAFSACDMIGLNAGNTSMTGNNNLLIGYTAGTALTSGAGNTFLGSSSGTLVTTGGSNVLIGYVAGDSMPVGGNNYCVIGSVLGPIAKVFIGNGVTANTPQAIIYNATGGSGSNIAGASFTIAGGIGTGTGLGGAIIFQTAIATTSSSTANTLATALTIDQAANIVPGTAALATTATNGWLYIETCAGVPTGVPAGSYTGRAPIVLNSSTGVLYAYNGSWVALAGSAVTGTGAAGDLTYWSGTSVITGSAGFTVSTTNGVHLSLAGATNEMLGTGAGNSSITGAGNTLIGGNAGNTLTSGFDNVFVGSGSGNGPTTAQYCVGIGYNVLTASAAGNSAVVAIGYEAAHVFTGSNAVLIGHEAGKVMTSATACTAVGYITLFNNVTGGNNTAVGYSALTLSTSGNNTAIGASALVTLVSNGDCTAVGYNALTLNTAAQCTAVGSQALATNSTGTDNTAIGYLALNLQATGTDCTAVGFEAGQNCVSSYCTFVGSKAGIGCTSSNNNTAVGYNSLTSGTVGTDNTAIGYNALNVTTSNFNTAVGSGAGSAITSGQYNVFLGYNAGSGPTTANYCIGIGYKALTASAAGNSAVVAIGYEAAQVFTGSNAVLIGHEAGKLMTSATACTAVGYTTLYTNVTGANNTAVGYSALMLSTSGNNTALGASALVTLVSNGDCTAVGYNALTLATGSGSTAVGSQAGSAMTTGTYNVFIGILAGDSTTITASNRCVIGSNTGAIGNVFIGNGETNASPQAIIYNATGGSGSNIAGASFTIAGGIGTGTGAGGSVIIQVAKAGTTGSSANTLATALTIDQSGNVVPGTGALATTATNGFTYMQSSAGAPTGVPTAFTGRMAYQYDTTNHKFWVYDTGTSTWKGVVLT